MAPLATAEEVAEYLRISPGTLAQWRYLGKGPRCIKVGQLCRYDWADVRAWLDFPTGGQASE